MTGATDVFPKRRSTSRERRGERREKKFTPRFGLFQSCSEGGTSENPSSPPSLSSPVGGDDDKSSRDVATHNQIRPPPSFLPITPPPASTLWLFPAPPPTTPDILRDRDSAENTAHVLDVPHTVHPSHPFSRPPPAFQENQPPDTTRFPLPPRCPPQPAREMVIRMCPSLPPARTGIADSRRKEIPGTIRINRDGMEGAGGACITSGLAGEEKNCRRLYTNCWIAAPWRRENTRFSAMKLHDVSAQRDRNYRSILNLCHVQTAEYLSLLYTFGWIKKIQLLLFFIY